MKPTARRQKDLLFVLVSSFILVIIWIGFSIYHKAVTSTISEDLQTQVVPINPNFDTDALKKLKSRVQISPAIGITGTPSASVSATTTPTPTIIASSSATASSSAKVTGGH